MSRTLATPSLKNKIILVTGAGSGIGRAIALEAAQAGATVILLSRNIKKLESIYDDILQKYAQKGACPEPLLLPINLLTLTPLEAQKIVQKIKEQFGALHGLVHCAGIVGQLTPIEQYPAHLWQEVLHLNLTIPFLLTQACLPLLKAASSSVVLFSSAPEGTEAKAYFGAYTCSKFGLEALKSVLIQELEHTPSVQIRSMTPQKVRTGLRAKIYPSEDPQTLSDPADIAREYVSLL